MSIADQDQYDAAVAEAKHTFQQMAPVLDARYLIQGAPATFLTAFVDRHNSAMVAGKGRRCIHALNRSPKVLHAAVWLLGLLVCEWCAGAGALRPENEAENWTCDVCRRYRPGQISVSLAQNGLYLVWFACCRECGDKIAEEART